MSETNGDVVLDPNLDAMTHFMEHGYSQDTTPTNNKSDVYVNPRGEKDWIDIRPNKIDAEIKKRPELRNYVTRAASHYLNSRERGHSGQQGYIFYAYDRFLDGVDIKTIAQEMYDSKENTIKQYLSLARGSMGAYINGGRR